MRRDPQQELFTELLVRLRRMSVECGVFDSVLPPDGTPYPFVYLGESQLVDDFGNKSHIVGTVYQTIHVWSDDPRKRGTVSDILLEIKDICRHIEQTENFTWLLSSTSQQIMPDNTTKTPLLHVVIEVAYRFG